MYDCCYWQLTSAKRGVKHRLIVIRPTSGCLRRHSHHEVVYSMWLCDRWFLVALCLGMGLACWNRLTLKCDFRLKVDLLPSAMGGQHSQHVFICGCTFVWQLTVNQADVMSVYNTVDSVHLLEGFRPNAQKCRAESAFQCYMDRFWI
jgi:hypothetical protein